MRRITLPANWGFAVLGLSLFSALVFSAPAQATPGSGAWPKEMIQASQNRIVLPVVMLSANMEPWLTRVNTYRSMAALGPVMNNPEWSLGAAAHARYIVATGTLLPYEDTLSPHYSPEGNLAAGFSLQLGQTSVNFTDNDTIDYWIRSPFQALALLDPQWTETGFGSHRATGGLYQTGAVLDVVRGFEETPQVTYPVFWPGNGSTTTLKTYSGYDDPNPLAHSNCANAQGLPIILQVGKGTSTVSLTTSTPTIIRLNGSPIFHCAFSEYEFTVPNDTDATEDGRLLLNQRDAVVMIPTNPLSAGAYSVTVTVLVDNVQRQYTWSFTVAN